MTQNTKTTQKAKKPALVASAALLGAGVAGLLAVELPKWESGPRGPELVAYKDIVGVWTICNGETLGVKRGQTETVEGCHIRLDKRIAQDFGPGVLKATPVLKGREAQLAAAILLAYNIGVPSYGKSTVARRFNALDFRGACDAFLMWNRAGGRVVQGLVNRREHERKLCLTGVK